MARKEQKPGIFVPIVDRTKCEGGHHHQCKNAGTPCIKACPYSVLQVLPLKAFDKHLLSTSERFRAWAHGNRQAYVTKPQECTACGLCVEACVMRAIKLRRQQFEK